MKFAHKITNVEGGNKLVTVTENNGKALVKMTMIPAGTAKRVGLTQKELVQNVQWSHEKSLEAEAAK
ncbi:hypothetical protein BOW94_gp09 [Escherichia phage GA2A]|uniref:Uncharacterized protein n=1 Tax=Escherichia phage GA2A TaxID=1755695 RepID=A0A1B0TR89_9CAUD|nr:hypothetical protein BOW94_gp09 [Escherichia phage GA2A]ALP47774.1 hypothetical protein GA2A_08 [Escherichia phage GA2A]